MKYDRCASGVRCGVGCDGMWFRSTINNLKKAGSNEYSHQNIKLFSPAFSEGQKS
jgi:hypothetical protein